MQKSKITIFVFFLLVFTSLSFATTDDAKVYWSLDNSDMSVLNPQDISGNGNNGTGTGITTGTSGILNEAVTFSLNDEIIYDSNPISNQAEGSISMWLKPNDITVLYWILQDRDGGTDGVQLGLNSGSVIFRIRRSGTNFDITTIKQLDINSFHHIVYSWDGSGQEVHINATSRATGGTSLGTSVASGSNLILGHHTETNDYIGVIDEVAIYDRKLNQTEIEELYNSGNGYNPYEFVGGNNATITAQDSSDSSSINIFNATVNGTFYETTNGTINLPYFNNETNVVNITVNAENYTSSSYTNYNISASLLASLDPLPLEDFTLLNPSNTLINRSVYEINWTEAVSPTAKTVTYNVSVYDLDDVLQESYATTDLNYSINFTDYGAGTYNITVNATESSTGVNYTKSSFLYIDATNYVYFKDAKDSSPLNNQNVSIVFPNSDTESFTTDSLGKIEYQSLRSLVPINGTTSITYLTDTGYVTPITFDYEATTLPYNITYNISRANLTVSIRDAETESLVTDNVTVTITNIGTFYTTTGSLTLENASIVSGDYVVYVSSDNYTFNQKTFTFTNQEELNITVFVFDKNSTNLGTVLINTYDSFLDIVPSADVRLQEYNPVTGSFIESGQRETNSNGQATFQILLESKSYRWYATATIGGVLYEAYSTLGGEIIYEDGTSIDIYLNTIVDTGDIYTNQLSVNVSNKNLVNNVSTHTVNFYDSTGVDHQICLGYYYVDGIIEKTSLEICEVGSSGSVAQVGGKDLTTLLSDYRVRVRAFDNTTGTIYYEQAYSSDNSFESEFGDLIKPLIMIGTVLALAIALLLGRIDMFVYINIFLGILWTLVAPSYMTGNNMALNIILGLCILYLAKQRSGVQTL